VIAFKRDLDLDRLAIAAHVNEGCYPAIGVNGILYWELAAIDGDSVCGERENLGGLGVRGVGVHGATSCVLLGPWSLPRKKILAQLFGPTRKISVFEAHYPSPLKGAWDKNIFWANRARAR